ncbi:MAG: ADP-ribosylation factor-like protein [Chloroflexota bacterium]
MYINWARRELNLKVVYYGPPLSGKTTNLVVIHQHTDPRRRGELIMLKTEDDRTLYFDFLRLDLNKIGGLTPRIHLYTVPGQPTYEASRRLVLRGADGVVFVADSARDKMDDNRRSWLGMITHLEALGLPFETLPLVVQFNKQDLPTALPAAAMRQLLQVNGYQTFEAVAIQGLGVFDTLKTIIHDVVLHLQQEMG